MKFAVPLVFLLLRASGIAQTPGFDDLSRRASAALQNQPAEAAKLYRQAVALKPSWAEGWFYLGASEYQLNQYASARDAFRRATTLAPENGASWAFLGLAEQQLNDDSQALQHILKSEALGLPENLAFVSQVRVRAASIYGRAGEFSLAVQQLEPLARAGDQSPAVIEALGVFALMRPYSVSPIPAEKRPLIELAGRAMWALYAKHTEEAAPLFKQLAEQYPREPGVHYVCGIYALDHDPPLAIAEFRKELAISPSHVFARLQIAMAEINSGAADAALEFAREAARMAPGNFLCHVTLGRALMDTKQTEDAIREFQAAVRLAPNYPHTHFYLGQAYRRAGKTAESQKEVAEFTRLKAAQGGESASSPGH